MIFNETYRKVYNPVKDYDEYFIDCTFYYLNGKTYKFTIKTSKQNDINKIEEALS